MTNTPNNPDDIETTAASGRQSRIASAFTEIPPTALFEVAKVMKLGRDKYGRHNWRQISILAEIDHAGEHLLNFLAQVETSRADPTPELAHAAARMLMALDQWLRRPDYLHETHPETDNDKFTPNHGENDAE